MILTPDDIKYLQRKQDECGDGLTEGGEPRFKIWLHKSFSLYIHVSDILTEELYGYWNTAKYIELWYWTNELSSVATKRYYHLPTESDFLYFSLQHFLFNR